MREGPAAQPVVWRRRRRRLRLTVPRRLLVAAAGLLLLAGIAGGIVYLAKRAARPDPAAAFAAGEVALKAANYSAARNHFISAVDGDPAKGEAQVALARTLILLGDGVAAGGALDRAVAAGTAPTSLHPLRAAALLLGGDTDGALAEAAKARGDADADRVGALAVAAKGDRAGAAQRLEALIARLPANAAAWRDLGRVRLDLGDVGGASVAAVRATTLDPRDLAALTLRGEVVRRRYGLIAALPWFDAALRRDAYYVPALLEQAATLGEIGRYTDSLGAIRRALAGRPGEPRALYLAAVIAARAGDRDLASALLARAGDGTAGIPGAMLLSGGLDYAGGRYEQAIATWRALVDRQPMNLAARRLLGAALLRSGDADAALAVLRPIALRADADSYTLGLVGRAFEAKGQRDWAARFLDRAARGAAGPSRPFGQDEDVAVLADAVNDAPGDPRLAVALIRGELERGQGAAALAGAQRLVAAAPGAPAAQQLLGDVLFVSGRAGPAAAAYARAADLRFDRPAMLRLIEARAAAGDRRGAAEVLALYLAQNPQAVDARRALANVQLAAGDDDAAATLDGLLDDVGNRDALLLAQAAAAHEGAGEDALAEARAAYRLQPMNLAVVAAYAQALAASGDAEGARQMTAKAGALRR
jgi:Flp pilus assembly protein TadD